MYKMRFERSLLVGLAWLLLAVTPATPWAFAESRNSEGALRAYLVLFRENRIDTALVAGTGGTVVATYPDIGVVIARSDRADFAAAVSASAAVEGASATDGFGIRAVGGIGGTIRTVRTGEIGPTAGSSWGDELSGHQWDMVQISALQAHTVTTGSRDVVVGDIDTGLDFTHPDLAPNYDAARSTDCTTGRPRPLLAGNDRNGNGTHTAGIIAAAANRVGIVGVAPTVRIASIKAATDDGFIFPEMVVCAFMWAGTHHIDITNNSYYADPWLFNCRNDPRQRTIWNAERRAIRFAQSSGTLVVASEGNDSSDRSHPRVDLISPDYPPGTEQYREITNACAVIPAEVPGVVGVSATGNRLLKSSYSSYGTSTTDVAGPGGDLRQITQAAPSGQVLSTWPADIPCEESIFDGTAKYCYRWGTGTAAPHVAGVAALIKSRHPGLAGGALAAAVQHATDSWNCPTDMSFYASFPQSDGSPQSCEGGAGHNSFYGSGEINALRAVS